MLELKLNHVSKRGPSWHQCSLYKCGIYVRSWYHTPRTPRDMMTSSNGNISALLAICAGNSPVTGEFPAQRPVTRSFDVFLYLRRNKRLGKQSGGWWFETPSPSLWRHCNERSAIFSSTQELAGLPPWTPPHCDMAGCWQINSILANIGRKTSIRV